MSGSTQTEDRNSQDSGPVPDRWLKCPRMGAQIHQFLPFKTPLDHRFDAKIPDQYQFTPEMFIQKWTSAKIEIGLVIDLTNTSRFYDKQIFIDHKIEYSCWKVRVIFAVFVIDFQYLFLTCLYTKIKCGGHKEAPTKQQTEVFIERVTQFLQNVAWSARKYDEFEASRYLKNWV